LYRSGRYSQHFRCVFNRESSEEAELHDATLLLVELCQFGKRDVEFQNVEVTLFGKSNGAVETEARRISTALGRFATAGVFYQDLAHDARGDSEKMCAALPLRHVLSL